MPELTPLAQRAKALFYLQAFSRLALFWAPVCTVAAVASAAGWSALYGPALALSWLFAMFLLALWYPALAFARYGYRLTEAELLIARGVIVRSVVSIPVSRIQHVDTRQGPIEQWMGLSRLQVYTASGVGGDGVIPGLLKQDAEALRDLLVEVRGDDGV